MCKDRRWREGHRQNTLGRRVARLGHGSVRGKAWRGGGRQKGRSVGADDYGETSIRIRVRIVSIWKETGHGLREGGTRRVVMRYNADT